MQPFRAMQRALQVVAAVVLFLPLLDLGLAVVRRTALGRSPWSARNGSTAGNGSGDIFIAFSTANEEAAKQTNIAPAMMLPNERMNPLFEATVQATEEAVINALVAAETMTGIDDHKVIALPHDRLQQVLKKYNRLTAPGKK